ncbi:unnamed protein product [Symbiodinium microadriaticum]|nr:unnamed protein product [Symbiodinium microadriaticum]
MAGYASAFWAPPGNQGPAGGAGPVLQQTPAGIEIKGRGRFRTPEAFEAMLDGLQTMLTTLLERNGRSGSDAACPVIQELDVSQNRLTLEQFETLFVSMGVAGAKVIRYRMFGCPTLDDQVLQSLANFLAGQVTADTAPWELHLSDCAITTDGFLALMDAIETSDLYPRPSPQNPAKGIPLYLRLENNYIAEDAIQQKVDAGLIQTFTKQMGPQMSFPGGPKVNLLARGDWKCQQLIKSALMEKTQAQVPARPNPAPAAFSAKQVPPRNVTTAPLKQVISVPAREFVQFGRAVAATQRTLGGTPAPALGVTTTPAGIRAESSVTKVAPSNGPRPSVAKARPKPQPEQSVAVPPAGSKAATTVRPRGSIGLDAKYRPPGSQETPATKRPRGSVGLASARSRTPAARKEQDAPINSSELPEDWEEHLSEEYGISYFWNRVTNESRWDRPST